jgi:hypothetical protein
MSLQVSRARRNSILVAWVSVPSIVRGSRLHCCVVYPISRAAGASMAEVPHIVQYLTGAAQASEGPMMVTRTSIHSHLQD